MDGDTNPTYECSTCHETFASLPVAQSHVIECGTNVAEDTGSQSPYQCTSCGTFFEDVSEYDCHEPLCPDRQSNATGGWTDQQVKALIDVMQQQEEARPFKTLLPRDKKAFWQRASEKTSMTAATCRIKWNSLVTSYKRVKDNRGKSKSGRGSLERWPYYDALEVILGNKSSITPSCVVESVESVSQTKAVATGNALVEEGPRGPKTNEDNPKKMSLKAGKRSGSEEVFEQYLKKKICLEEQRLALEEKRLELEDRRMTLLEEMVNEMRTKPRGEML